MLYREIAPVSKQAWNEINSRAEEVLKSYLSARKLVYVDGPKGLDFNVITEGRLGDIEISEGVEYGSYQVAPLTETRVEFELDRIELDNVLRGAKDVDYEPLEEAMKKIALFEENAIYNGLENSIKGLNEYVEDDIAFGDNPNAIIKSITKGLIQLRKAFEQGPYTLVVNEEAYTRIVSKETAYPLDERIKALIGGNIIYNHVIDGAYLLPYDHEDLELTIGRDFSIGYQSHSEEKVKFFASESFTFRVLNPDLIVKFSL
ncbi:MAG TPA: family 1 encapsulin nanocompartment shell protein [Tissierellaceae bacterium]|nr:family 1 encapsulin nanocompartment shell protein [Tissierellaceae bacterium]